MSFAPGTVFAGDYRIERPLSQGGMGAVFVATQLSTGKPRALKLMNSSLVYDPESLRRFEQEARVGARIASEHVVEVVAAGVDRATAIPYLVMELLEGEDLLSRLKRGPLAPEELATVLEQLAHALGAAHDAGVVHRDLKPENVFLGVSRRSGASLVVKVLDFGIAKVTEDQRRTTAAFGTPMWLAPEQTHRGEITPAADVWALALLVYAMTTGHFFWRSGESATGSIATLMSEILHEPIPLASLRAAEQGSRVPDGLDGWLARALDRDPRARFPNSRAAFAALAPILRPRAEPPEPIPSRGRAVWLVVVAAVVGLGGVGLWLAATRVPRGPKLAATASASIASESASSSPALGVVAVPTDAASAAPIAAATFPVNVNGMGVSGDAALQSELMTRLDTGLAEDLARCFANRAGASRTGSLLLKLEAAADGRVASVAELYAQHHEPVLQCMLGELRKATFASRARPASVTFTLLWSPR